MNKKYLYLALIITFLLSSCAKKAKLAEKEVKPLFVKFEAAQTESIIKDFETVGELKADKEILVAAERQGQVEKVFVTEGQRVQKGDPLIEIKGKDVNANMSRAKEEYLAYKKLFDEGAISSQELLKYETALKVSEANFDNLLLTAIEGGQIGQIYVDPGDYVKAGDKVMDLVKLYPLRLSYSVPEKIISYLKIGQDLSFSLDNYPDKEFQARVDFISPRISPETRSLLVRARVLKPEAAMKANQFVKIKQVIEDIPKTLMVREEAIFLDQEQEYIFLADDKNAGSGEVGESAEPVMPNYVAKRVAVKTGLRKPGKVEILQGLEQGDLVIYAGLHSIYPGAELVRVHGDAK